MSEEGEDSVESVQQMQLVRQATHVQPNNGRERNDARSHYSRWYLPLPTLPTTHAT